MSDRRRRLTLQRLRKSLKTLHLAQQSGYLFDGASGSAGIRVPDLLLVAINLLEQAIQIQEQAEDPNAFVFNRSELLVSLKKSYE